MKSLQLINLNGQQMINPAHVVRLAFVPAHLFEREVPEEGDDEPIPARLEITLSSVKLQSYSEGYEHVTTPCAASVSEVITLRGLAAENVWRMFESYAMYPQSEPSLEPHL